MQWLLDIFYTCWILFGVYWILAATSGKPAERTQTVASYALMSLPMALGGILITGVLKIPFPGTRILPFTLPLVGLADLLTLVGLGIAVWARLNIRGNWSGTITVKQGHELIRTGPYRYVRHPIYSALLLMLSGFAFINGTASALLGFSLICFGFLRQSRVEETILIQTFGESYIQYIRDVKSLIPGIF